MTPPQDKEHYKITLLKVLDANHSFAPVYVELSRMYLRTGNLNNALVTARRAAQLEPSRAGYNLLVGNVLARMGKGADAVPIAQFVADRWSGPDHNEAVDLWNAIAADQRPAGQTIPYEIPDGVKSVEGSLRSLDCGDKDHKLQLTIDHDGQALTLRADGPFGAGYSDTLWYGSDHFSLCKHLEGMHVIARYKPVADSNYGGNLTVLEVREVLPEAPAVDKPTEKQP
jgi:tetratricopeptide (TPR) repeat protein